MVALALPLAPLAPGAAAAAGTFVIGSAAYIAQQIHGFRAPLPAPMIPRTGGKAGGATMQEMVADAIAGARIPVALPPNPLGPRGSIGLVGLLAAAGFVRKGLSQLWGYLTSRPKVGAPEGWPAAWEATGKVGSTGGSVLIRITATQMQRSCSVNASTKCYGPEVVQTQASAVKVYGAGGGGVVSAGLSTKRVCGYNTAQVSLAKTANPADGTLDGSFISSVGMTACGDITGYQVRLEYTNPTGSQANPVLPTYPTAVAGWVGPRAPQLLPARAPVLPGSPPTTTPAPRPEPERDPVPVQPGPSRVPWFPVRVPSTAPKAPPVPARVIVVRPDGKLPAPAKDPVTVTHPDWHFPIPGKGPITGNGPQAKPEEIAKELGRLEQKLNAMLNPTPDTPVEWQEFLKQLWEMFQNLQDAKTYKITEKCPPCDADQEYIPPTVEVTAPGATSALGVIANRIDAIAALLDGQLGLKQQICAPCPPPSYVGRNISVRFRSAEASPYSGARLRKVFRYRDQSGKDLVLHSEHWENFHWLSGHWIVISDGLSWGRPQVWAASAEEGKRVLEHAALIAGVDLKDTKHRWTIREAGGLRANPVLRMNVDRSLQGGPWVVERDGPSGRPVGVVQLPTALGSQLDSNQPHL